MSKKTVHFQHLLRKNDGKADSVIPQKTAKGAGTYLMDTSTAFAKGPHGLRGVGAVCSQPMSDEKAARVRALVKKK